MGTQQANTVADTVIAEATHGKWKFSKFARPIEHGVGVL